MTMYANNMTMTMIDELGEGHQQRLILHTFVAIQQHFAQVLGEEPRLGLGHHLWPRLQAPHALEVLCRIVRQDIDELLRGVHVEGYSSLPLHEQDVGPITERVPNASARLNPLVHEVRCEVHGLVRQSLLHVLLKLVLQFLFFELFQIFMH